MPRVRFALLNIDGAERPRRPPSLTRATASRGSATTVASALASSHSPWKGFGELSTGKSFLLAGTSADASRGLKPPSFSTPTTVTDSARTPDAQCLALCHATISHAMNAARSCCHAVINALRCAQRIVQTPGSARHAVLRRSSIALWTFSRSQPTAM